LQRRKPVHHRYMSNLLMHFTGIKWHTVWTAWRFWLIRDAASTGELRVALVSPTFWRVCIHCVVLHDQTVFDPAEPRPSALQAYSRQSWYCNFLLIARSGDRLRQVRQKNWCRLVSECGTNDDACRLLAGNACPIL
jgi:hypothetical protein